MSSNGQTTTDSRTRGSAEDQAFVKRQGVLLHWMAVTPNAANVLQVPEIEEQVYDYYDIRYGAVVYSEDWHLGEELKAEWATTVDSALVEAGYSIAKHQRDYVKRLESTDFDAGAKARFRVELLQMDAAEEALRAVVVERQQRAILRRRERQAAMQMHEEQLRITMRLQHQQQMERENAQRAHELALKEKELEAERLRGQREDSERDLDRKHELELHDVRSRLRRMELGTTQPFELQKNLSSLILAAWEKQERDPTARATFGNLNEIISQASTAVTRLTMDQDPDGQPLDDDSRQQRTAEALELVMRVADRLINRL